MCSISAADCLSILSCSVIRHVPFAACEAAILAILCQRIKPNGHAYGEALEMNLQNLSDRVKRGAYRAKPVRRVYIPKPDGRQRPLGVTAPEDKIVQRATVTVLNTIYESDFLGFSYRFRPGRSPHHALDALYTGLLTRKVNWVLDTDIRGFFDAIDHEWLVKFVEHRVADRRVVRLIRKWLRAGVLEDGARDT